MHIYDHEHACMHIWSLTVILYNTKIVLLHVYVLRCTNANTCVSMASMQWMQREKSCIYWYICKHAHTHAQGRLSRHVLKRGKRMHVCVQEHLVHTCTQMPINTYRKHICTCTEIKTCLRTYTHIEMYSPANPMASRTPLDCSKTPDWWWALHEVSEGHMVAHACVWKCVHVRVRMYAHEKHGGMCALQMRSEFVWA